MRIRTKEEVEAEFRETMEEYHEAFRLACPNRGHGYFGWRCPQYVPKMNEAIVHIKNLYLELNRIKIRDWENRAKQHSEEQL